MLSWRSGNASASQDAAKQVRATPLNGSNDVRNRWYQYWNVSRIISQLAVEIQPQMRARAVCSYPKSEAPWYSSASCGCESPQDQLRAT